MSALVATNTDHKRTVDVPVLQFQETVEVSMTTPQERISDRILEHLEVSA